VSDPVIPVESVFRLANVLNHVIDAVPAEVIMNLKNADAGVILLARGIPAAEEDLYWILGQILGFADGTSPDAKQAAGDKARDLPATHVPKIFEAVMEQEDLEALFFEMKRLIGKATEKASTEDAAPSPE
jgi:hypothetical protein